jgi:hypothetical protein
MIEDKLIKILDKIDIEPILKSYNELEHNIHWVDYPTTRQAGLQYRAGNDPWLDAVGSSRANFTKSWYENVFINPYFKDTIFEEIIVKCGMTRARLIWVKPFSCYSFHVDNEPRLHIPLITNNQCFFVFKEIPIYHMKPGNLYWANTTKFHTFINCSTEPRLHLISCELVRTSCFF